MKAIALILLFILLAGCGTTQLVTYNSNVEIYVNNQLKGKGQANLTRTGPPQTSHIEAKYHGGKVGSLDLKRRVTIGTVVIGLYTYGIGFFLAWKYPETVIIPIDDLMEKKGFDQFESIWDMPPGEWKK